MAGARWYKGRWTTTGSPEWRRAKGSTILRNVPAYDQDAVDDRPSIRVKDQDFQGFFTSKDEHAVITVEMEKELRQKYSTSAT